MSDSPIRVLFVCLGNICRSPMAEAVFQHLVMETGLEKKFLIESAATSRWEIGERPHPGTQAVLKQHHIPLSASKRARQIRADEINRWDYIIAMDWENVASLKALGANSRRLLEFAPSSATQDIPDPYYENNFDLVYQMVMAGSYGLLEHIRKEKNLA